MNAIARTDRREQSIPSAAGMAAKMNQPAVKYGANGITNHVITKNGAKQMPKTAITSPARLFIKTPPANTEWAGA